MPRAASKDYELLVILGIDQAVSQGHHKVSTAYLGTLGAGFKEKSNS